MIEDYETTAQKLAESWVNGNRTDVRNEIETWAHEHQPTGCWLAIRVYELLKADARCVEEKFKSFFLED